MRHVAKPLLLVVIVAVALWFMQDRDHASEPADSTTTATVSSTTAPSQAPVTSPTPTLSSAPVASPSPTSAVNDEPASVTLDEGEHEGDVVVDPTAAAVPRDAAQRTRFATYEQAAADFLTAFARPAADVSREQWWAKVSPHLDELAVAAYDGTDPAAVPFTTVTGPAVILPTDAPADLLMLARVPTDAGFYRVEMTTGPDGIRISRVTPEGTGQ